MRGLSVHHAMDGLRKKCSGFFGQNGRVCGGVCLVGPMEYIIHVHGIGLVMVVMYTSVGWLMVVCGWSNCWYSAIERARWISE